MLKKLLRKFMCTHRYLAYSYHMEQIAPEEYKKVTVWKCSKCGKEQWHK